MRQDHANVNGFKSIYNVPAVDRAAHIMTKLASRTREMTLAEIAVSTGYHKSSVHKILLTLCQHKFLVRDEFTKRYSLGVGLLQCGQAVLDNLNINHSAKSCLQELSDFSGETANLGVLNGLQIVIVDSVEAENAIRVVPPIGTMDSVVNKSNGKAIMACYPIDLVNSIIEKEGLQVYTKNSITSVKNYLKELAVVREQGYATDFEEVRQGINAVSAAVYDSRGNVAGVLSITGPAFRLTREKMSIFGKKCADLAKRVLFPAKR